MRTKRVMTKDAPKPTVVEKRGSQWEALMRKFSEDHKEECKAVPVDIPRADRDMKEFPTGSTYQGSWDVLGMSGYGVYKFPNGVVYAGDFEDGMFHGDGELRYPSGIVIRGLWNKGTLDDRTLIFADGIRYSEVDWDYCKMPDRRFAIEFDFGLQAAGNAFLTADQPTRDIPPGHYDTGDGFYEEKTKVVYSAEDASAIIRAPAKPEQEWILANCRSNIDQPLGPRPDLYEEWPEPLLNPTADAKTASIASFACGCKDWGDENEGGERRFSTFGQQQRPKRVSITSARSVEEFGARQQKSRFRWGDIAVVDQ